MKGKPIIYAVDFDGTLCEYAWPDIGKPNYELISFLQTARENGVKIILWTCRVDDALTAAVEWCRKHELEFDAVNENLPEIIEAFGSDSRKVYADFYFDDRFSSEFRLPFKVDRGTKCYEYEVSSGVTYAAGEIFVPEDATDVEVRAAILDDLRHAVGIENISYMPTGL